MIGVNVLDNDKFDEYCHAIQPLLAIYDGRFCYDFKIPNNCIASRHQHINRVFAVQFSSKDHMNAFFADREYLKTRGRHILKSIGGEQFVFGFEKDI